MAINMIIQNYCFNVYTPNSSNLKSELNEKIKIKELELKKINLKINVLNAENESLFLKSPKELHQRKNFGCSCLKLR